MSSRHEPSTRGLHLRLPRGTVRFSLAVLSGGLFLALGGILLGGTYAMFDYLTGRSLDSSSSRTNSGGPSAGSTPPAGAGHRQGVNQNALALHQHTTDLHLLLVVSGIALGIMVLISVALGWIVAGRILRPLQTITKAARDISVTDLHYRFAANGPDDELKDLSDTFDRMLARLEAAFEAQRQFIANASHELRTPLARQRVLSQIALTDPGATVESLRSAHERVLVSGAQQERVIEALLTLARGQAGISSQEPFDLAGLLSRVVEMREPEAGRLGLRISTELSPAPAAGSPRLAERLAGNLVDNAIAHNAAGGFIDIATKTVDGHSVLTVINSGPVVPATDVSQLFQPFQRFRSENARQGNGLGLGLSIVAAIASAHGATIDTSIRVEGGLAVAVSFPLAVAAHDDQDTPSSAAPPGPGGQTFAGARLCGYLSSKTTRRWLRSSPSACAVPRWPST
jgi:signal transduction histidine kinase